MCNKKLHISIEGNIGSGKSTLLCSLKKYIDFPIYQENVANWKYLTKYYQNPNKYAFALQAEILEDLYSTLEGTTQLVTERCGKTSVNVFALLNMEQGNISREEFDFLVQLEQKVSQPTHYIYLQLQPSELIQRIQTRGRAGESSISLDYLQLVHEKQELFLSNVKQPVFLIDASKDQNSVLEQTLLILKTLL